MAKHFTLVCLVYSVVMGLNTTNYCSLNLGGFEYFCFICSRAFLKTKLLVLCSAAALYPGTLLFPYTSPYMLNTTESLQALFVSLIEVCISYSIFNVTDNQQNVSERQTMLWKRIKKCKYSFKKKQPGYINMHTP